MTAIHQEPETSRVLAVRLDGLGDVLLAGPAIRALAAGSDHVTLLTSPAGAEAAPLLPGVDDVLIYEAPWIEADAAPLNTGRLRFLQQELELGDFDEAVVFTSVHQSPLPMALLLRMAGVPRVSAICADDAGSLLDVRHEEDADIPEPERSLSLARAAGFALPSRDDGRLSLLRPLPNVTALAPPGEYVVVHPGRTAPAQTWPTERWAEAVHALSEAGHTVVVTGAPDERELTAAIAGSSGIDLGGRTTLAELASLLHGAQVAIAPNTGPAHLAAAVGTPVVSPFASTHACTRLAPGHACLDGVSALDVVAAVEKLLPEHTIAIDERPAQAPDSGSGSDSIT